MRRVLKVLEAGDGQVAVVTVDEGGESMVVAGM